MRLSSSLVEAVRLAERGQYPVGIGRCQGSWVRGFVVQVDERWMVVQTLNPGVYVQGYDVLRVADVTEVEAHPKGGFIERAVAGLGGRPPVEFSLPQGAGTREVLVAAAAQAKFICVYLEALWDSPLLIGHLGRLGSRKFEMDLINSRGVWDDVVSRWWYGDVTRVSFGCRYEAALERFGDERPSSARVDGGETALGPGLS